ncbi:DUF1553 domain-containing protein [Luteolibacter algae]|uniref:DUF1553 domain-containing protein n=1 Tax=Luteolibacter algae TaxID=454151 RepID=A0ABW5D8U8_9BACT
MDLKDQALISAYLDGSLSPLERDSLNQLLRTDPAAREALLLQTGMHQSLIDLADTPTGHRDVVVPFDSAGQPAEPSKNHSRSRALAVAAAIVGMASVAIYFVGSGEEQKAREIAGTASENQRSPLSPKETYDLTMTRMKDTGSLKRSVSQGPTPLPATEGKLSYNQHIRPILSENCFHCHGPDPAKREGDIALHTAELAFAESGGFAPIVPGDAEKSEAILRIFDEHDPMPPTDSNRSLTEEQKDLLRRWVNEGAEYEDHWAFVKPEKVPLPEVKETKAPQHNAIDAFIQKKLEETDLSPSEEAPPEVLARRASLALTGLQPDEKLLQSYLSDSKPGAYERLVDRLLDTDSYAERMALYWLDAARYADTDGYQNDHERTNWPWRDWVIKSFRDNQPFDEFTIEQLAGDMLPDATPQQRLASAFNRNHRQNSEGGALAEEFLVENVIDRVETTSTVWLGLTTGCARCHDHKYDPISQREFFQLYAFFNNIGEQGIGKGIDTHPILNIGSPLNPRPADLQAKLDQATKVLQEEKQNASERFDSWFEKQHSVALASTNDWSPANLIRSNFVKKDGGKGSFKKLPDNSYLLEGAGDQATTYELMINPGDRKAITGVRIDAMPGSFLRGFDKSGDGSFILNEVEFSYSSRTGNKRGTLKVREAAADEESSSGIAMNSVDGREETGWEVESDAGEKVSVYYIFENPVPTDNDYRITVKLRFNTDEPHQNIKRFRVLVTEKAQPSTREPLAVSSKIFEALRLAKADLTESQAELLRKYHQSVDPGLMDVRYNEQLVQAELTRKGYGNVPVMVMEEKSGARSPAYLLNRGQYDDPDKSEELPRGVIEAIFQGDKQPGDRLELARWIVSRDNPITARVVVNRMWQHLMGVGLVKTTEDFGSQAEMPSHPELLDWLAVEFIDSGWDTKAMYKLIATSHAFRQSSRSSAKLNEVDPENRLLARGPRYRLDGFAIRDLALNASGLLNPTLGGAPVKPYQPAGLWESVAANKGEGYRTSTGKDLYRKSMYSYWKRAVNPPRQVIFDSSSREVCNVRHKVTNTPLQALALMNDETFVEAARHLAARGIREGGSDVAGRLNHIYHLATGYRPDSAQIAIFTGNFQHFLAHFTEHPSEATDFLSIGESPRDESIDLAEHAAYTAVSHLILNLDETITLE